MRNRILTFFFAALFGLNVGHLLLGFASIPIYYERVTTLTIEPYGMLTNGMPTNEAVIEKAATRGMTLPQYAVSQVLYHSAIVGLCLAVALLIVLRARGNWFAWYSATLLLFIAEFAFYDEVYVAHLLPQWVYETGALFWPLVLLYFYLFPNGKPAPRRALWIIVPGLMIHFVFQTAGYLLVAFPDSQIESSLDGILDVAQAVIVGLLLFILGCQIYRYVRVSTPEERQQTKWFLFGFILFMALSTLSEALGSANPFRDEVGLLIFAFVPLSIGIAILRYRLWDIDLIIRRTLTYALVVALLAFVYFGSVILLQQAFAAVSGQRSEVITVISTLVIAALFVPLRNRIQSAIERRFYRRKYNAQKVLQGFGETVRDETDLEKLTARLLEVVQETMQPRSVAVWLKGTTDRGRRTTDDR